MKARTAVNDYYKKVQNYTKAKKQIPASLISKISGDGYSTLSVSYTHLDVYKRQGLDYIRKLLRKDGYYNAEVA